MRLITIVMSFGLLYACGSSPSGPTPPDRDGGSSTISPSIRAISPTKAPAGSSDLTLTVIGTNFVDGFPVNTFAMWSANGANTPLATRFVSATELSVGIPAKLLSEPAAATVLVETGDSSAVSDGFHAFAKSNPVRFDVFAPPPDWPSITSISPTSATAGSSGLTLNITGTNFTDTSPAAGDYVRSWVRWSANGTVTELVGETKVVSSTELTVTIPAPLLTNAGTARLWVANVDMMAEDGNYDVFPKSTSVSFEIVAAAAGTTLLYR